MHLSELHYCDVTIEGMSEPVVALRDSGAQISLIKLDLISDRNLPKLGTIAIRGVVGDSVDAALVQLTIKPSPDPQYENIAPYINVMLVACDLSTDVDIILCESVVNQLDELET